MDKPGIAIIGTGRLGAVLAQRLVASGYSVEAVFSRDAERAHAVATRIDAPVASTSLADVPPGVRLVFCCVPDDAIGTVARTLSAVRPDWTGTVVAHTSGALPAAALYRLSERGAAVLSFHPLQSFSPQSLPDAFEGIAIALEGDTEAMALGTRLTSDLGARSLRLTPEAKTRYHLAASMASNYLVTLMALVNEVLASIDLDRSASAALMQPLVEGTWRNLHGRLPEDALTGPIVRGDHHTVAAHLEALADHLPHLVPVYVALGVETVRVAVRSGRLAPKAAQQVLDTLHEPLEPRDSPY